MKDPSLKRGDCLNPNLDGVRNPLKNAELKDHGLTAWVSPNLMKSMPKTQVIIIFLGLFLSGCMVGPNYHRPCLDIPPSYHYEVSDPKGSLEISWWKTFQDPVIDYLVEDALANNKD